MTQGSRARGILGVFVFAKKHLLDGQSIGEAKAGTHALLDELAPVTDPALAALDDVVTKHAARKRMSKEGASPAGPARRAGDDATVIDTTGEEVRDPPEPPRRRGRKSAALVRRKAG